MPLGITFRDVRYTQYYGSTTVYRGTKFHGNSTAEVTVLYGTNFILLTTALAWKVMQLILDGPRNHK